MGDNVLLILLFCVTVVSIVGIVALVVYNRDQLAMKIAASNRITDKVKSDFSIEVDDKAPKKK
ncbi:hypothetical protein [Alkaliphilus sp. B6464]|uniref:hypothetical protein n=1 Tax=Alkaliphilus sp. B6464 TaxID=2731219 RepID=UPI001BA8A5E1|nr:hypothetical protein [Alkaliphilus sp. B6464]QUH21798.1 hypothetical protein HYG84_17840 [Alkaliphilus sp. B6464]